MTLSLPFVRSSMFKCFALFLARFFLLAFCLMASETFVITDQNNSADIQDSSIEIEFSVEAALRILGSSITQQDLDILTQSLTTIQFSIIRDMYFGASKHYEQSFRQHLGARSPPTSTFS